MEERAPEFLTGPGLAREAYDFASEAHEGQERKGDGSPYINHPVALAQLLHEAGLDDEELLAATFLHDVVEDTDTTLDEIEEAFGTGVHDLVEAMTEDKDIEPYERRKQHHRDQVEAGGERAVLIYAADKVANLRDLRTLYANVGEGAASRFNAPLDVRVRLWEGDAEMIERVHPGHGLGAQLRSELAAFQAERETTA
ncbi:MAG: guanosine-3,5-bis(diphosphate) 3-pyrophosphohydrolase [Solirubrobacterales bacterium]|nr:guanosine-3,5-bis(diphosphate) 3-pyrophosphohydrolase [Solirubrobacterales bacterium]